MIIKKNILSLFILFVLMIMCANSFITLNKYVQLKSRIAKSLSPTLSALKSKLKRLPSIFGGLKLLNIGYEIIGGTIDDNEKNFSEVKNDLSTILEELQKLNIHISDESNRIINELRHSIESQNIMEPMRKSMEKIQEPVFNTIKYLINSSYTGITVDLRLQELLNFYSPYRITLRSFVSSFIDAKFNVPSGEESKLFFDLILESDKLLKKDDNDCYQESIHNKISKTFICIVEILTQGYAIVIAAHTIQYFRDQSSNKSSDASTIKDEAEDVVIEYVDQINSLIKKTKWALANSSKEIRNCGSFDLIEGKTFERLNFIQGLPQFYKVEYLQVLGLKLSSYCRLYDSGMPFAITNNFTFFSCKEHTKPGYYSLYYDINDENRPYHAMEYQMISDDKIESFGNKNNDTSLTKYTNMYVNTCPAYFCQAFKKNHTGVSTQVLMANVGNVITGVRWRIKNNIIYLDIEQGEFLNEIGVVDDKTYWTQASHNENEIHYFDNNTLRHIVVNDINFSENVFVVGVKLDISLANDGMKIIGIKMFGADKTNIVSQLQYHTITQINNDIKDNWYFIDLNKPDDPENAEKGLKNLQYKLKNNTTKKYALIKFQMTDWIRDFGRTTVPYFDIRKINTKPSSPINGIGSYYQTISGYGGFIGLKLFSPSLSHLLEYDHQAAVDHYDD